MFTSRLDVVFSKFDIVEPDIDVVHVYGGITTPSDDRSSSRAKLETYSRLRCCQGSNCRSHASFANERPERLFPYGKHHQHVAAGGRLHLGIQLRQVTLANGASARGHRHILLAVNGVADWIALDRSVQWNLPEDLSVLRIKGSEVAIEVAGEHEAARRRQHRSDRNALIVGPQHLAR